MQTEKFNKVFDFQRKSKIKASEGLDEGEFPFYTSSPNLSKYLKDFQINDHCLVFGTGGNPSIHFTEKPFSVSTDCLVAKVNEHFYELIDPKYVYYYFKSNAELLENGFRGIGLKHISKGYIGDLDIPIIDINEQKRLVKKLDQANYLFNKRKESIELLDEYLRTIFLDMFGDPVSNPKEWPIKTIEELVQNVKYSIKRGPFGSSLKKDMFVDNGYLVYEQYHALNRDFSFERYYINDKKFEELKAFAVKAGDIIISCSGVYLGKLAEIPQNYKKGIINQALLKLSINQEIMRNRVFMDIFTSQSFKAKYLDNKIGSGIPNFPPISVFKTFKFICPDLQVQKDYEGKVEKVENFKKKMEEELDEFEKLIEILNNKYLTINRDGSRS